MDILYTKNTSSRPMLRLCWLQISRQNVGAISCPERDLWEAILNDLNVFVVHQATGKIAEASFGAEDEVTSLHCLHVTAAEASFCQVKICKTFSPSYHLNSFDINIYCIIFPE